MHKLVFTSTVYQPIPTKLGRSWFEPMEMVDFRMLSSVFETHSSSSSLVAVWAQLVVLSPALFSYHANVMMTSRSKVEYEPLQMNFLP